MAITGRPVMAASGQSPRWGAQGSEADVDPEVWTVLHPGMDYRFAWSEQSAELLVDLGHVAERVQFTVVSLESSGGLGVVSQPVAAILLQLT
jgi:hypothetical protein